MRIVPQNDVPRMEKNPFRHRALSQVMVHYIKPWCIISSHGALSQAMVHYLKPWCIISNHGALSQTIVHYHAEGTCRL